MDDIIDESEKKHCLTLGGKQDHGFFPLLKNMGIDLKYLIGITDNTKLRGKEKFQVYNNLFFWN